MRRHENKQWSDARTLADLGELMAKWIEADLQTRPGYHGPSDLDTAELEVLCGDLCRSGYVTENSQAADEWDDRGTVMQARAWITGFAGDDTLARLRAACEGTDLMVFAYRTPPRRWWPQRRRSIEDSVPIVANALGLDYALVEGPFSRSDVRTMWDGVSGEALDAVLDAWQVTVLDPRWCRNDLLIDTLTSRFLAGAR